MNKSNRSSAHPKTDAMIALAICLLPADASAPGTGISISAMFFPPPFVSRRGPRHCEPRPSFVLCSAAGEFRRTLGVEGLYAFLEVLRLAQAAVAMAFELDCDRQRRILGVVEELLCR